MNKLKPYRGTFQATNCEGSQTFGCMASSESEAREIFRTGDMVFIYQEIEVMGSEDADTIDIEQESYVEDEDSLSHELEQTKKQLKEAENVIEMIADTKYPFASAYYKKYPKETK